jgi:hypothetical protein
MVFSPNPASGKYHRRLNSAEITKMQDRNQLVGMLNEVVPREKRKVFKTFGGNNHADRRVPNEGVIVKRNPGIYYLFFGLEYR